MQSWRRSSGEQVRAVSSDMARKVARVKAQAERVPRGMFLVSAFYYSKKSIPYHIKKAKKESNHDSCESKSTKHYCALKESSLRH